MEEGETGEQVPSAPVKKAGAAERPMRRQRENTSMLRPVGGDQGLSGATIMRPRRLHSSLSGSPCGTHGMADRSLQALLGRQLRAIFADVANEPVPDRFVRLLEALAAREGRD